MGFPVFGLIGDKYTAAGGKFGAATSAEANFSDQAGKRQDFENGSILWCPKLGSAFMLTFFRPPDKRWKIEIEWGPSDPFHYDFWIVRWNVSDNEPWPDWMWQQKDLPNTNPGIGPTHGWWEFQYPYASLPGTPDGGQNHWFLVEGCDNPGNATCRQGWSPMTATRFFTRPE
jgi:hypothetical protein